MLVPVMVLLYTILMVSTLALLWATAACYFRIRRHTEDPEHNLHGVLTEMDRERDVAIV